MKLKFELTDDKGQNWHGEVELMETGSKEVSSHTIKRSTKKTSRKGTMKSRILELKEENFFNQPRTVSEVKEELKLTRVPL